MGHPVGKFIEHLLENNIATIDPATPTSNSAIPPLPPLPLRCCGGGQTVLRVVQWRKFNECVLFCDCLTVFKLGSIQKLVQVGPTNSISRDKLMLHIHTIYIYEYLCIYI